MTRRYLPPGNEQDNGSSLSTHITVVRQRFSHCKKACLAKRRSEHSYKRAPSYTDVASMKLKQDVESSWQCPFVSVSKEESEAQHAFCNVKSSEKGGKSLSN